MKKLLLALVLMAVPEVALACQQWECYEIFGVQRCRCR